MAIPDLQMIMLPLLRLTGDGAEHTLVATAQAVSDDFPLTPKSERSHYPTPTRRSSTTAWHGPPPTCGMRRC